MATNESSRKRRRDNMDGETAIAFAANCFQQLHPRNECPEWLSRCTTVGYHWDIDDNYILSFTLTPKSTNDAVSYFKVSVDPTTAETKVLLDTGLAMFNGEELQGY